MKALTGFPLIAAALLFSGLDYARAACGVVEVSKGDVKIEAAQTKKVSPAPMGAKICSGDTITAGKDSRAKLKMEDGNELNISPDSKIVLETYQFNPAQNKKKVLLNVLQGKIRATTKQENMYNDNAGDGQANTFQVRTKSAVAGVRGTDFLTGYDPKTQKSEIVTFRGKVDVGQPGPGGSITNSVSVTAGQKTETSLGQPPAPPRPVPVKELDKVNIETKPDAAPAPDKKSDSGDKSTDKAGDKSGDKSTDKSADKQNDKKSDSVAKRPDSDLKKDDSPNDKKGDSAGSSASGGKANSNSSPNSPSNTSGTSSSGSSATTGSAVAGSAATGSTASGAMSPGATTSTDTKTDTRTPASEIPKSTLAPPPTALPPPPPPTAAIGGGGPQVYLPPMPPFVPLPPQIPICDSCNAAVQNGPAKLNINVHIKQ